MEQQQIPAYTVVSTQPVMIRDQSNLPVRGVRVNVRFADGSTNYVEVPFSPDWAQQAQQEIEQLHSNHHDVMSIQGPMIDHPTTRLRQR